jgi:phosphatidylglycerophosphate synthase
MSKHVVEYAYWLFDPLARCLHSVRVSANQITLFSLVPGLAAGVASCFGLFGFGVVFATMAAFCDAIDGLVARKQDAASDAGEALDATVDRYMEFFLQAGLCIHYRHDAPLFLTCVAAILGSFAVSFTSALAEARRVAIPRGAMRRAERALYLLLGMGFTPPFSALVGPNKPLWLREAPMFLALAMVAVIANVSAIRRRRALSLACAEVVRTSRVG